SPQAKDDCFGPLASEVYDDLYADKDYAAECTLIESILHQFQFGAGTRVLDLGCGTGSHALPLAARGYHVVGVDRSSAMLARARDKAARRGLDISFQQGDIRAVSLEERFDCVLLMFAVLGYQVEDADIEQTLACARCHLRPHGLLIFDVWYG